MPGVQDARTLANIPFFSGVDVPTLEHINQRLRKHTFQAGANVITAETPGEAVYIILNGTVKIKVDQADGKEVIIAILGAGALVGELSVIDSIGRSADVLTQEQSTLLWLDRNTFNDLVDTNPTVTRNLLKILSSRLRLSTEQIQALCTLDVYGMVARQILAFADLYGVRVNEGVTIPMRLTQSDIAGLVGASRERVNQVFVQLREGELISVSPAYRITVTNDEKLRDLVSQR